MSVAKASMVGGKTCINFSNTPLQPNFHVDFGEAKRGRLTKLLELRNATNAEITIELEKFPKLESLSIGKTRWSILPGESVEEALTWEPSQEGKFREKLAFVHQHNGRKRRIEGKRRDLKVGLFINVFLYSDTLWERVGDTEEDETEAPDEAYEED